MNHTKQDTCEKKNSHIYICTCYHILYAYFQKVTSVSRSGRWQLTLTVSAEEVQLSCKTHVYLESLCGKPSCNTCRLLFFLCPGEACLCQKLQKDVSSSERRKLPAYAMKKAERYCDIMSTDAVPGGDTEMDFVVFSIRNLAM